MGEGTLAVNFFRGRTSIVIPPTELPLDVPYVRDYHLRCVNGAVEDLYIENLIKASVSAGEQFTQRAWMPQTRSLTLSAFTDDIQIPYPPFISMVSVSYLDGDGISQVLDPTDYQVMAPKGPFAQPAILRNMSGGTWPTLYSDTLEAVTLTYECGYVDYESPPNPDVPDGLLQGALLMIGELYKVRSVSVHTINQNPSIIGHEAMWNPYRVLDLLHRYTQGWTSL